MAAINQQVKKAFFQKLKAINSYPFEPLIYKKK